LSSLPKIPGYQIEKELGSGGMGVVYAASRADTGYRYAVKMLLVGRTASFADLARFRVEAEAYACLNHSCIIKIRDVGVVCGCPYLAMDFAENGSLDTHLKSTPHLDVDWKVQTIRQVADGLSHAHGRRILHRDLKPANILIMADGTPRVSDFGLVKFCAPLADISQACCTRSVSELDEHLMRLANENRRLLPIDEKCQDYNAAVQTLSHCCAERTGVSAASFNVTAVQQFVKQVLQTKRFSGELSALGLDDMTQPGFVMGSPYFMSPEQAMGHIDSLGPHTDVYGLGATLYKVLTDRPPISGSTSWEVIRNVPVEVPTPPAVVKGGVSEDLSHVVMKSLEKDPKHRYPTMDMFAEDLERVLCGRPPLARLDAHSISRRGRNPSRVRALAGSVTTWLFRGSKRDTKQQDR
jgi:serine/threonine protein kinase